MAPLFTIVTTVYNKEKYLPKAIDSVLGQQKVSDFELVLVNDGSKDQSAKVMDEYAAKDSRIRAIHKENGGSSSAYNRGIEEARGKYILFLDGDDFLEPNALEILEEQTKIYDFDLIFMNLACSTADEDGNIISHANTRSSMKEEFRIYGKKNIENSWKMFMGFGLTRNAVNCYKASILKKHRFIDGIWCADAFLNIDIANDITSASCHPADLYNGITYAIKKLDMSLNISTGKFYEYEHEVFNQISFRYAELFASWGHMDTAAELLISRQRVTGLIKYEVSKIHAPNCNYSLDEKVVRLCEYYDDIIVSASRITDQFDMVQNEIIDACYRILNMNKQKGNVQQKQHSHFMTGLFKSEKKYLKRPSSAGLSEVYKAVTAPDNIYRLGLSRYESLARKSKYKNHLKQAAHLRVKESVKYLLSSSNLKEVEPLVPKLNERPEDLEGYALLACYYMLADNFEKSREILEQGMAIHPSLGEVVNQMLA